MTHPLRRALGPELAEAAGAFALVLAGCGAIMVEALTGAVTPLGIALAFGLVIGAMIYATGHISGAHFNPAVTFAFALTGHFPWRRVPGYLVAQLGGAIAAAGLLRTAFGDVATLGATTPADFVTVPGFLLIEVLLTGMLMFVIASVATDGRAVGIMAGAAIGGTVALGAIWGGPVTGASMNPARSIGPALVAAEPTWILHYVGAPLVGAALGALLYEAMRGGTRPKKLVVPSAEQAIDDHAVAEVRT